MIEQCEPLPKLALHFSIIIDWRFPHALYVYIRITLFLACLLGRYSAEYKSIDYDRFLHVCYFYM